MPIGAGDSGSPGAGLTVGVLALQGAFDLHRRRLEQLGARAPLVRTPADLDGLDAIVLPGGESTTMSRLLTTSGLFDELKGRPLFEGARGAKPVDKRMIAEAISKLSVFAAAHKDAIESIEMNPLRVMPDRCVALDALIVKK
jgi:5'-phosphate synthase pdxT subunit